MKIAYILSVISFCGLAACAKEGVNSSDQIQQNQQEKMLKAATDKVGMPAIVNFQERQLAKMILELRDKPNYSTYSYLWNEMKGEMVFLCNSIGYGLPYSTQFTNPSKVEYFNSGRWESSSYQVMPQADPNGLFSPDSADGTWVMCKDPKGDEVKPIFVEPKVIVSPFKLD